MTASSARMKIPAREGGESARLVKGKSKGQKTARTKRRAEQKGTQKSDKTQGLKRKKEKMSRRKKQGGPCAQQWSGRRQIPKSSRNAVVPYPNTPERKRTKKNTSGARHIEMRKRGERQYRKTGRGRKKTMVSGKPPGHKMRVESLQGGWKAESRGPPSIQLLGGKKR